MQHKPLNKTPAFSSVNNAMQFEALFNYATIGIVITNRKGEIINFNKQSEIQFGYSKHEVLGQPIELLIPQKFHSKHTDYRNNFYQHPQNRPMGSMRDLYARKKDGSEFPVEVSLSFYNTNGDMHIIAFVIDITIRKSSESVVLLQKAELESFNTKIKQMNTELEQKIEDRTKMLKETLAELEKSKNELTDAFEKEKELSDLKSRFVTMASHEFRTPLSTILSSASLIGRYDEPDEKEKRDSHIQRIKSAVSVLKNILEDFLSLGKLEEGSLQTNVEVLKSEVFKAEIEEVIQDMQQIVKPGQTIKFNYFGEDDVKIDIALLKNIIVNLTSNAIKFSPENSIIQVICDNNDGGELVIKVIDKGIGISAEDQVHLFERFFRAKNVANIQGTGLGLHIITRYLELMKGRIEVKSQLNEGSMFIVCIPQTGIKA